MFVRARNLTNACSVHPDQFNVAKVDTVTLSAAQIIAMGTTPVTVIAAPASNEVINVESITFQMKPGTTQFTGGGAVTFVYHGTSTNPHLSTANIPAATVTSATGSATMMPPIAANVSSVTGLGVDIKNATAAFATGNGTAVITIAYTVTTLQ